MKYRFVGDVHGKYTRYVDAIQGCERSIQVGDFGMGFGPTQTLEETVFKDGNHRFIRGNHDSPAMCALSRGWIDDGTVEDDMMFVGGAWSIDYARRIPGLDWWPDEELSQERLYEIGHLYYNVKPKVMVTHDCPLSVSKKLFVDRGLGLGTKSIPTRTGQAFESMFKDHKPKLYIFGHWHNDVDEVIDGTRFICLNELSFVDINIETYEVIWPAGHKLRT